MQKSHPKGIENHISTKTTCAEEVSNDEATQGRSSKPPNSHLQRRLRFPCTVPGIVIGNPLGKQLNLPLESSETL